MPGHDWAVADPTDITEINCYAIVIEGEPSSELKSCTDLGGAAVLKPESIYAFVPGGKEIEIDVRTGMKKFSILGLVASSPSACVGVGTTIVPQYASLSIPQLVGTKEFEVRSGGNSLEMSISLTGATKVEDCGWPGAASTPIPAPSALSYSGFPATFTVGTTISATDPTVSGTVTTWSISPSLPSGLSFDTANGEIAGTPTVVAASTSYTITASNAGGSTTTTISITVANAAPTSLSYTSSSPTYYVGTAISANTGTYTGVVTSWSVSPSLPAGLALNASTGVITGTPTSVVGATGYTVTATNETGFTTATVNITVAANVPTLSYSGATGASGTVGFAMSVSPTTLNSNGAAVTSCGIKAATTALPVTLSVDSSCVISGTPTVAMGPTTYTLVATNAMGNSSDATVSIAVGTAWEWVNGSALISGAATFGTRGTVDAANVPHARSGAASFQTGNELWVFGGIESHSTGCETWGCEWNDLWKFDLTTRQWTWMKGSSSGESGGNYGTNGLANLLNEPPARSIAGSWTDASGNFWLFGGNRFDTPSIYFLQDLWRYEPGNNKWTWMHGSSSTNAVATYGTKGVAHANNVPGSRYPNATWRSGGFLYMHGGQGYGTSTQGQLADLWKYDTSANTWTWIAGPSTLNEPAVYGVKGVADTPNHPGARENSVSWVDGSGNLWLYGGTTGGSITYLADLWKFDISTLKWTWVAGSNTTNKVAVYGTKGVSAAANTPGSRTGASGWVSSNGSLILFGGQTCLFADAGCGAGGTVKATNDVWKYSTATNEWTWIGGTQSNDVTGDYGTIDVIAVNNQIGTRNGALAWNVAGDSVYVFGGYGYASSGGGGYLNDLWRFIFE